MGDDGEEDMGAKDDGPCLNPVATKISRKQ